jgi:hypothetical protein
MKMEILCRRKMKNFDEDAKLSVAARYLVKELLSLHAIDGVLAERMERGGGWRTFIFRLQRRRGRPTEPEWSGPVA